MDHWYLLCSSPTTTYDYNVLIDIIIGIKKKKNTYSN